MLIRRSEKHHLHADQFSGIDWNTVMVVNVLSQRASSCVPSISCSFHGDT